MKTHPIPEASFSPGIGDSVTLKQHIAAYIAILLTVLVLDTVWLGFIAMDFYQSGIGHLMATSPNLIAAAAFYFLYPLGLMVFAVLPTRSSPVMRAAKTGALFGLFAYATYDLSNLATLENWPISLALTDMVWGSFISAVASAAGAWCLRATRLSK